MSIDIGREVSIAEIKQAVADVCDLHVKDLASGKQTRCITRPRQLAMYLAYELSPIGYAAIGRLFGFRDHTTVRHAVLQTQDRIKRADPEVTAVIDHVLDRLKHPGQARLPLEEQHP
jgi:chromosomal replication initiator protein